MELQTARLIGRPPMPDDVDLYRDLLNDPDVARTMGGLRSDAEVRAALQRHLDSWAAHGFGPLVLHDRATGEFVGRGGLNTVTPIDAVEVEVGYVLRPQFWGRGLATELARAAIRSAFDELTCPSVVGFTLPTNAASRHVMEKCGMVYERDFIHFGLPHVLLRVRPGSFVDAGR